MAQRAQRAEGTAPPPPPPLPVVCIAGATASGKSRLALALASALEVQGRLAAVVNADALQVYRGLERLTDQPGPGAQRQARHELYGFLSPAEPSSAARWLAAAADVLAACRAEGRLPIFCGGTGLYFQALTRGLAPVPPVEADRRARLEARLAALGKGPSTPSWPHWTQRKRPASGRTTRRGWCARGRSWRPRGGPCRGGGPASARGRGRERGLRARAGAGRSCVRCCRWCSSRLPRRSARPSLPALRLCSGGEGLEEARRLLAGSGGGDGGGRPPAAKALGVAEAEAVLAGRLAPNEAAEQLAARTRRYARRQRTWARSRLLDGPGRPLLLEQRFAPPDEAALLARVKAALAEAQAGASGGQMRATGRANAGKCGPSAGDGAETGRRQA